MQSSVTSISPSTSTRFQVPLDLRRLGADVHLHGHLTTFDQQPAVIVVGDHATLIAKGPAAGCCVWSWCPFVVVASSVDGRALAY